MNETKLERCPFCGTDGIVYHGIVNNNYRVECANGDCPASYMIGASFRTEEDAAAAWNRRTPLPENKALTVEPVGVYLLNDVLTEKITPICCGCQGRVGRNDLYCKHCGSLLRCPPEKE